MDINLFLFLNPTTFIILFILLLKLNNEFTNNK